MTSNLKWLPLPEDHDYPAAQAYLSLLYEPVKLVSVIQQLRGIDVTYFKAKDIFRASGLSLLGVSNLHVEKDRQKILASTPLSPLLLVRDSTLTKVVVADGYHRLCAVYGFNEDAVIPCKIVTMC